MKKYLLHIVALLLSLALADCDVHEFPDIEEPAPPVPEEPVLELQITLDAPDWPELTTVEWAADGRGSRSPQPRTGSRADAHMMRFSVNIYDDYTDSRLPSRNLKSAHTWCTDVPAQLADVAERITLDLQPGEYIAVAWIDYVDAANPDADLYYDTSDMASISILGDDHPGNSHYREAFRGATRFIVDADGHAVDTESRAPVEVIPLVAERPMARYEFVTTDLDEFIKNNVAPMLEAAAGDAAGAPNGAPSASAGPNLDDYTVHIRYASYMPSTYNCHTNRPVDARTGVSYYGRIVRKTDKEATLGFDHVFVNGTETTVQVALDVYSAATGSLLASTDMMTVPLKRNHHTYIKGKFLTTKASGGAGINPDFDGQFNIFIE